MASQPSQQNKNSDLCKCLDFHFFTQIISTFLQYVLHDIFITCILADLSGVEGMVTARREGCLASRAARKIV